jgi:hypothetical protein
MTRANFFTGRMFALFVFAIDLSYN